MVKTVGVLGAGQMGNGITHVFAQFGYDVVVCDISSAQVEFAEYITVFLFCFAL